MTRLQIEKLLENSVAEALGLRAPLHRRVAHGRAAHLSRSKPTPAKVQRRA